MKKVLIILGCIVAGFAILIVVAFAQMTEKVDVVVADMEAIGTIDMDQVKDGTYSSAQDAGLVKVTVEVTVKDHTIEDIKLLRHQNGKGAPAEAMLDVMLEKNTPEVDTVSGATLSSLTIKAAVMDALNQGI